MHPPHKSQYERVDSIPDGCAWKPGAGPQPKECTVLYSLGNIYKIVRFKATGEVHYFKLKDTGPEKSPADQIDAEPKRPQQIRFRKGTQCWFVDAAARWYLCSVLERDAKRIVLKPETGMDAERATPWPYPDTLEIPAKQNNALYLRLRPLAARYR